MLVVLFSLLLAAAQPAVQDSPALAEHYRKWIEEEVVHIISEDEKAIFLKLTSNAQRDRFIKEFWEQRDPTPGTEKNEFKEEHYRRIDYANTWFGRETRAPGWRTARGKIYIQLGEPKQKRAYSTHQKLQDQEMWFYDADPRLGVPPFFYVLFFKKFGVGDYILYDPTLHGPEALIFLNAGQAPEQAPMLIGEYDMELAQASINLVPTEVSSIEDYKGRPALSSINLMTQIENIPNYHRSSEYAQRILSGLPKVETTYNFDASGLSADFNVVKLGSGFSALNYSFLLTPGKLELGQYKDTIYSALEVILSVMTPDGTPLISETRRVDRDFVRADELKLKASGLYYQASTLILPGTYDVTLTVRNKISRIFFSQTRKIEVPGFRAQGLTVGEPLLFPKSRSGEMIRLSAIPPYAYGNMTFLPNLAEAVMKGQEFGVFYQVYAAPAADNQPVSLTLRLIDTTGKEAMRQPAQLDPRSFDANGTSTNFWRFSTAELPAGVYRLEITAARGTEEHKATSRDFSVANSAVPFDPFVSTGNTLDFSGSAPIIEQARQVTTLGHKEVALTMLRNALADFPTDQRLRAELATAYAENGKMDEAIDQYLELSLQYPENLEYKRSLAGLYLRTGKYAKAIGYFEQVRLKEGDTIEILNPLGEAYQGSGNVEKAKELWRRSLQIEANQPQIKRMLEL